MTDATKKAPGPLAGVRVIDMTTVIMGPYATQVMADYGADVIKVEPPDGDVMRHGGAMRNPGMGALFMQINRNKRSIVIDVKREEGRAALLKLCGDADVFVSNVRPAAMARSRLGEADIRAVSPKIIYASLVGYGQTGPYAPLPAYDDLFQGRVGIAALIGKQGGTEPRFVPVTVVDRVVGLNAAHAILAALFHRERTGEAQAIEVPMLETMAQFVLGDHMGGRMFQPELGEPGYSRLLAPDRRPYKTRDGYVCTLVYTDKQWRAFFRAIGRTDAEFEGDTRLNNQHARARNYPVLYTMVAEELAKKTTAEWMEIFQKHDIPVGPVNDLDDLIDDPHLNEVGFFQEMDHPSEGQIKMLGVPSRWSVTQPKITRPTPNLGEHSEEILREAGFSAGEIASLIQGGAVISHAHVQARAAEPAA
jgi:crotonobetainyl-CoA:carnitine CoA-transferase CaiB-like acyl-CoA transferase